MENIRSFDCMPSPAIKAVMANFSSVMSTLNDSELNSGRRTLGFLEGLALLSACGSSASGMSGLQ